VGRAPRAPGPRARCQRRRAARDAKPRSHAECHLFAPRPDTNLFAAGLFQRSAASGAGPAPLRRTRPLRTKQIPVTAPLALLSLPSVRLFFGARTPHCASSGGAAPRCASAGGHAPQTEYTPRVRIFSLQRWPAAAAAAAAGGVGPAGWRAAAGGPRDVTLAGARGGGGGARRHGKCCHRVPDCAAALRVGAAGGPWLSSAQPAAARAPDPRSEDPERAP
jgi:hypothetical protein